MAPGPGSYEVRSIWNVKENEKGKKSNFHDLDILKKVSKSSYKSIYYK